MAALSIKNDLTYELANELASLEGKSVTQAVTDAIRDALARKRRERDREAMIADAREIARRCAPLLRNLDAKDPTAFLYDENGLPK